MSIFSDELSILTDHSDELSIFSDELSIFLTDYSDELSIFSDELSIFLTDYSDELSIFSDELSIFLTDYSDELSIFSDELSIFLTDYSDELSNFMCGDPVPLKYTLSDESITAACGSTRGHRDAYNYLILDFTQLQQRELQFERFVSAVVYVGKGTRRRGEKQRPHDHIRDALNYRSTKRLSVILEWVHLMGVNFFKKLYSCTQLMICMHGNATVSCFNVDQVTKSPTFKLTLQ